MAKIRKQTYTMSMLMEYIRDKDIRDDADVQRASGQWSSEQINELVMTVLTDGYIPPIFIGEDLNLQKWLIDGLQRSTSLKWFRYGNYRITPAIRNSVIAYRAKVKDENGNIMEEDGDIVWKEEAFDIRNKTYDDLPGELKKQFDSFQMEAVIFEECTMEKMSELIQVYNNHTPMNITQKAFTYVNQYARNIREIAQSRFFADYSNYSEKEKTKGVTERVVLETVMCMFHLGHWKKQVKQIGIYLNANASKKEFDTLSAHLHRLEHVVTDDVKSIFNSKDSFIFLTLFDRFANLGLEDRRFNDFLREFKTNLRNTERNEENQLFDQIDKGRGTKDKAIILKKLNMAHALMATYLQADQAEEKEDEAFRLICRHVNPDVDREDMEEYREVLEGLTMRVNRASKLLEEPNRPSLLAMVAFSFSADLDLDRWIVDYFKRKHTYILNQKQNFLNMKKDLLCFLQKESR